MSKKFAFGSCIICMYDCALECNATASRIESAVMQIDFMSVDFFSVRKGLLLQLHFERIDFFLLVDYIQGELFNFLQQLCLHASHFITILPYIFSGRNARQVTLGFYFMFELIEG